MMRNYCLLICCVSLCLGSGCQSGTSGFRNPFRNPFVKAVPDPSADLVAQSKLSAEKTPDDSDREMSSEDSEPAAVASMSSISDPFTESEIESSTTSSEITDLLQQADQAYGANRYSEAESFYQGVVSLDPKNVHAHHRLAIIADLKKNYSLAESHYMAALNVEPENLNLLNDLGYSYYQQKKFNESAAYLTYVLEQDPGYQRALQNLGLVFAAQGKKAQAYTLMRKGGLDPEVIQPQIQKAVAHAGETSGSQHAQSVASMQNSADTGIQRTSRETQTGLTSQSLGNFPQEFPMSPEFSPSDPSQTPTTTRVEKPTFVSQANDSSRRSTGLSSPSADHLLERTALNTGFGNLFPIVPSQHYHRTHQTRPVSYEHQGINSNAASQAYHEEFGDLQAGSSRVQNAHHTGRDVPAMTTSASGSTNDVFPGTNQPYQESPPISFSGSPSRTLPVTQGRAQFPSANNYNRFPRSTEQPQSLPPTGANSPSPSQTGIQDGTSLRQPDYGESQNAMREYQQGLQNEQASPFGANTYR
ncbi:MAG: tetratricopeptide repeat protein [Planctomycetaceae bacterium]|nr:tetratricopeptide repeat protein [Planctomycetaceae bacterium]